MPAKRVWLPPRQFTFAFMAQLELCRRVRLIVNMKVDKGEGSRPSISASDHLSSSLSQCLSCCHACRGLEYHRTLQGLAIFHRHQFIISVRNQSVGHVASVSRIALVAIIQQPVRNDIVSKLIVLPRTEFVFDDPAIFDRRALSLSRRGGQTSGRGRRHHHLQTAKALVVDAKRDLDRLLNSATCEGKIGKGVAEAMEFSELSWPGRISSHLHVIGSEHMKRSMMSRSLGKSSCGRAHSRRERTTAPPARRTTVLPKSPSASNLKIPAFSLSVSFLPLP